MNGATSPRSFFRSVVEELPADLKGVLDLVASRRTTEAVGQDPVEEEESSYDEILATAWDRAAKKTRNFTREMQQATHLEVDLLSLPPDRRKAFLLNRPRLHTMAMVTRLLRLSWDQRSIDPNDSEQLALLALEILGQAETEPDLTPLVEDLRSRAWGQIGNARRIQSHLQDADEALAQARQHLAHGSQDPLEHAMIDHWTGGLRRGQRRFEEAIVLLKRACRDYRSIRDRVNHVNALITLGYTYREAGDSEEGLVVMRRAGELLPPGHDLLLYVRHNQIYCLIDLGHHEEAAALLRDTRPLYAHASEPLVRLRLPWIEGILAKSTNQLDEAEYLFQKVRRGFIEYGIAYDAALVSLELAEIYVQQGRHDELNELAQEMVTVFRSRNVERETLAALLMLQHAASAERASLHLVRDIAERLRQHAPQALTPLSSEGG